MEEPNALIRGAIFFFAGGDSIWWGSLIVTVTVAIGISPIRGWRLAKPWNLILVALGLVLAVCGSPSVPIGLIVVTLVWLFAVIWKYTRRSAVPSVSSSDSPEGLRPSATEWFWRLSPWAWLLVTVAVELPFCFWSPPTERITRLLVIGDSVTA